jgi:hypothetical protein
MIQQSERPLVAVRRGAYPAETVYSTEQFSQRSQGAGQLPAKLGQSYEAFLEKLGKPTRRNLRDNGWWLDVGASLIPATLIGAGQL